MKPPHTHTEIELNPSTTLYLSANSFPLFSSIFSFLPTQELVKKMNRPRVWAADGTWQLT